jgi:hypothetical protein
MSLVQDLGAQLRVTSAELPTAQIAVAMQRLRSASDLLMWVRQTSVDPIGVPQVANAVEHAERAAAALRIAQDTLAGYLTAIGLSGDAAAPPDGGWKAGLQPEQPTAPAPEAAGEPPAERLGGWWQARVTELTGQSAPEAGETHTGGGADTAELLRRVAAGVRAGDRARLGRELHAVNAAVGLNLSAITPGVLRHLAGDLLGHPPRPEDLPRLRGAATDRTRALLPGIAPDLIDTLLARVCRASGAPAAPAHPADAAVTAGVLTGVLLARLGRDPGSLDPSAPEPVPTAAAPGSGPDRTSSGRASSGRDA